MKWRDIPKIDAHVHIIPDEVHAANPDSNDEFSFAKVSSYQKIMDQFNIRKAIIMPFNDPWLMSMDFTDYAVHRNLLSICEEDDRFSCFADVDIRNTPENTCDQIQKALVHSEFCGIKLHPNNDMYPLSWTSKEGGLSLCGIHTNTKKWLSNCTIKVSGRKLHPICLQKSFDIRF